MTPPVVPEAAPRTGAPRLRFADQKHWARNLHYDFRLEIGTVLVSWPVRRGLTKQLRERPPGAHVQDNTFDYLWPGQTHPHGEYAAAEASQGSFGELDMSDG